MTTGPKAIISRASFFADMSRTSAPKIPLGVYLEVVWPQNGRWFGVIGRGQVTDSERRLLPTSEFPELNAPWEFLRREFETAWEDSVGNSLVNLSQKYRWALNISAPEPYDLGSVYVEGEPFEKLAERLSAHLNTFQQTELRPVEVSPNTVLPGIHSRKVVPVRTETALEAA